MVYTKVFQRFILRINALSTDIHYTNYASVSVISFSGTDFLCDLILRIQIIASGSR